MTPRTSLSPIVRKCVALAAASLAATFLASLPARAQAIPCGTTLYQSVTLTADVVCPQNGSTEGLIIGADYIRIDLNGFAIRGPHPLGLGYPGIVSSGFEGVEIIGPGKIDWLFAPPIYIEGGSNHVIRDVTAPQDWGMPVMLDDVSKSVVERNQFLAIQLYSHPGQRAEGNRIVNNEIGSGPSGGAGSIDLGGCGTVENLVSGNVFAPTHGYSNEIRVFAGASVNTIYLNTLTGTIVVAGASDNSITGNTLRVGPRSTYGIEIIALNGSVNPCGGPPWSANGNLVQGNRLFSGSVGIKLGDGSVGPATVTGNRIKANKLSDHGLAGLFFEKGANGNDGRGNAYFNISRPVIDSGFSNLWP